MLAVDTCVCRCDVCMLVDKSRSDEGYVREVFLGSPFWVLVLHQSAASYPKFVLVHEDHWCKHGAFSVASSSPRATPGSLWWLWLILDFFRLFSHCCTWIWWSEAAQTVLKVWFKDINFQRYLLFFGGWIWFLFFLFYCMLLSLASSLVSQGIKRNNFSASVNFSNHQVKGE